MKIATTLSLLMLLCFWSHGTGHPQDASTSSVADVPDISGVWRHVAYRDSFSEVTRSQEVRIYSAFVHNMRVHCVFIGNRTYTGDTFMYEIVGVRPDSYLELDLIPAFSNFTDEDDEKPNEFGVSFSPGQHYFFYIEQENRVAFRCLAKIDGDVMTIYQPDSTNDPRPDSIPDGLPPSGVIEILHRQPDDEMNPADRTDC